MKEKIKKYLIESSYVKMKTSEYCLNEIEKATRWILESYQEGGKLVLFGNGGSAADAQHIAGELVNYFRIPGRPMIECLSLTTNTSIITAIANDTSYDNVFSKQIESLVNCKDIVIAISTSGKAKSVRNGIIMAKKRGAKTIAMTGLNGQKLADMADLAIVIPSDDTPKIQESHIAIGHIMCEIVEHELFKEYKNNEGEIKNQASSTVPVRLNFGNGGDTDYYIEKLGWGCVINTTLDSHNYTCAIKKSDINNIKIIITNSFYIGDYDKTKKEYFINNLNEMAKTDLIAAAILEVYPNFRGEIIIESNVPEMSGLGGSSSLMISIINSLLQIKGNNKLNEEKIAELAYYIEREVLGIKGGYQDQFSAAFASGFNYMEFKKIKPSDKKIKALVLPLKINQSNLDKIEDSLLLFYLSKRDINGSQAHAEQEKKLIENEDKIIKILNEKKENTIEMKEALESGDIEYIGKLLHKEYEYKKMLSDKTTNSYIEDIYETAIKNGAYGGKLSGAGNGGCMFLICNPDKKYELINLIQESGGIYMPCTITKN